MTSEEIRKRFLTFFEKRGHAIIPSASLVPENDPSVLFNTAGMQPLVPYLLGEKHPKGNRIANVQKCVRTQDIDQVGDKIHDTFFEMPGNWSFGDYFKKDQITWFYEFLTSKDGGLALNPSRIYITCFAGDENAPKDTESAEIWESIGIPKNRIYFLKENWWSPGENGPCGPDSEAFYDLTEGGLGDMDHSGFIEADDREDVVEIGNSVFMEYEKKNGKIIGKLKQNNVDFGGGLERMTMAVQEVDNIFDTDLFKPIMSVIPMGDEKARRIVADHIRTATFIIADGVLPSNTDRGYILRRLLRRAVRYADLLGMEPGSLKDIAVLVVEKYEDIYENLKSQKENILSTILQEEEKFRKTIERGMKEFNKFSDISGKDAFILFSTYGFPLELTLELAEEKGISINEDDFQKEFKNHQEESRKGAEKKFKGGLADNSEKTTMLHTATHLMLAGLKKYLGENVHQAGSNITNERTRFDFTHNEKVSREILDQVEEYVNEAISNKCDILIEQMDKKEAQHEGVEGSFWDKYPDVVNVYSIVCDDGTIYSQELCGGPHVKNTRDIKGTFKIKKEEASSAGVRRIKAVLE